jgi:hypothetical protein
VGSVDSTLVRSRRQLRQIIEPNASWVFFFIPILPSAIRIAGRCPDDSPGDCVTGKMQKKAQALADKGFSPPLAKGVAFAALPWRKVAEALFAG